MKILLLSLFVMNAWAGSDLYYFSPEQAAAAKERFGIRIYRTPTEVRFDSDVPANIQKQMLGDLEFIASIKGSEGSPLHQKIFGSVDGKSYANFFKTRVTGIGLDDCGHGNAVACVIPWSDPSKMWLTENFINFSHPQIARLMIVFHESRHTETEHGNWSHATCPEPFLNDKDEAMKSIWTGASLASEPACDSTPLGSYGSSAIMLKNIQKRCVNCTDKVKMDAGLYADDQMGRITNASAKKQIQADFKKLDLLEEILKSKNDNDPRLDQEFNTLSPEAKILFQKKYQELPKEQRNERGTIAYLLGKNLSSKQDWDFMRKVVGESPFLGPADPVTLAYPSLVALKLAERALEQGRFIKEALSVMAAGKKSPVPIVARLAKSLTPANAAHQN